MFQLLLCVKTLTSVYDYAVFLHQLSRVQFTDDITHLTVLEDEQTGQEIYALERNRPQFEQCVQFAERTGWQCWLESDYFGKWIHLKTPRNFPSSVTPRELCIPLNNTSFVLVYVYKKIIVNLDAHLISCIMNQVASSQIFLKRFCKYLRRVFRYKWQYVYSESMPYLSSNVNIDSTISIPYLVDLNLIWPKLKIDYKWSYRMEGQVKKRALLEENMAYLSTLGGGYSALGDYFLHHAERAGKISVDEFRICQELGDDITAAKCCLFYAQSLMQRGYLKRAKPIIRHQYKFAIQTSVVYDERLVAMCKAAWSRLQYLHKCRRSCEDQCTGSEAFM